jgi:hypothetical protein
MVKTEESEVISKEAPKSRTRAVPEKSLTEPAVPVEEEPEASSRLSRTMSCSMKPGGEDPHEPEGARIPGEAGTLC